MEHEDAGATTFTVRWEQGRTVGIVDACGEVDLAAVADFKTALVEAAGADDALIIDLSGVTYMDSSGFSTLLEVNRFLRPMGLSLYLAGANANIQRMLEITRLDTIFDVEDTVETAMARVAARNTTSTEAAVAA